MSKTNEFKIIAVVCDISSFNASELYANAKEYRKNKVDLLVNEEDKLLSLSAEYAIMCSFEKFGLDYSKEDIRTTKNGKPVLKSNNAFFNYSHSGTKALCVISTNPVGCDIQLKKEANLDIAKRFFTYAEYQYILSTNPNDAFYKFWTLKESYLKCIGDGLKKPLNSFEMVLNNNSINIKQLDEFSKYSFKTMEEDNYQISICVEGDVNLDDVKILTM